MSETFIHERITHGEIRAGLLLDGDQVDLTGAVTIEPLADMAAMRTLTPLKVAISEVDVFGSAYANKNVVLTGEVIKPSISGSQITAKIVPGGTIWDRQFPKFLVSVPCNHSLFSPAPACGLIKTAWKFTAIVTGYTADRTRALSLSNLTRLNGASQTFFADWFSLGWIEWRRGKDCVNLPILNSTEPSGGNMVVGLHGDPSPVPTAGSRIYLYPGCDGAFKTCKAYDGTSNPKGKFDNDENFGGHPFLPAGNPTVVMVQQAGAAGGKK